MSKKKVTVPRTYNPGKGRPKEYLAYLNWQEMQELQRINGGNMERGPKGLPSFPPAGAMSGGSAKSPASTSTSKAAGSTASKSTTSGKMGASSSQTGGVRSTSTAKSTSTASKSTTSGKMGASSSQTGGVRSATGGGGGGGGGGTSGRIGSAVTGARVGTSNLGISRGVSGGGGGGGGVSRPAVTGGAGRDSTRGIGVGAGTTAIGRSDKSAISAANKANARSAENTPALKNDRARSTGPGGGVLQAPVRETSPGQRISGAIRSVQQPVSTATRSVGAPAATIQIGSTPMSTQGISFGTPAAARAFNMAVSGRTAAGVPASGSFPSPAQIRAETQARLNAQRMAQQPVDFTGANSPFADPSVVSYTRPGITDYPSAPQGVYGPRTGVGIGYLSPAVTPGMITTGMPSPYSGTIQPRYNAEATLKAYEAEKRAPVQAKIQDRVPTATPTTPQGRVAVPGLITNPSLSRPMTSEDAFRQYAEMRNPTAIPISQPLPTPKPIQDRLNVVPSWEQSAYTGVGQFDVPVDGKIQDRINVVPSPEQSLYTGRPPQRISEAPPYAGAERVLRVENIMSDAGIRKSIPGFAPSGPPVVAGGESYVNPAGVPESVRRALDAAGFNPDGTRKTAVDPYSRDDGMRAPAAPQVVSPRGDLQVPVDPSLPGRLEAISGISPYAREDMARIAGLGSESLAQSIESFGDYAGGLYNNTVRGLTEDAARFAEYAGNLYDNTVRGLTQDIGGLFSGGYRRPGDVISGPSGLSIVNPDGSESPYPSVPRPSTPMASQGVSYATPADAATAATTILAAEADRQARLQSGLPAPTGEQSISGVRAIPTPDSIGMLPDGYRPPETPKQVTVRSGDSLTKIARENDTTVESLLNANPQITDPNRIREGQKINVPGEGAPGEGDGEPSDYSASPSQGMTEDQEKRVDETLKRVKNFQRGAGTATGLITGTPVNLLARPLTDAYIKDVKERLDRYAAMTDAEKVVAETRDPALIGWGRIAGIPSVNDYSVYTAWAEKSGLRAPQSSGGGGGRESGIGALAGIDYPYVSGAIGGSPSRDSGSTPSTPTGARPYIYYEWDLGLNIPSPSDPKYTDYQKYLAERAAAQASFGMV